MMPDDNYVRGEVPDDAFVPVEEQSNPGPADEIPPDFDPAQPPAKFGYPLFMMSDRDLQEEIVFQGRSLAAALAQFQSMGPADLVKSLLKPKG